MRYRDDVVNAFKALHLTRTERRSSILTSAARADARIAELEQSVTIRDTEIARLETDLELARRDAERWKSGHRRYWYTRMLNPAEFQSLWIRSMTSGMSFDELVEAKIDEESKARAGNGETGDAA